MKRKGTKKSLNKFSKRATHKRKSDKARREALLKIIEESGVGSSALKISDVTDGGRRARTSAKKRHDERIVEGVFSGARGGFGFVTPREGGEDIFIPEGRTGGAIDGDLVEAVYHEYSSYTGDRKTEGRVTKILAVGREVVLGVLDYERTSSRFGRSRKRRIVLLPDDPKIALLPIVTDTAGAAIGEKVAVKISRGSGTPYNPECRVVAVLGDPESKEANYEAILLESGIPMEFGEEVLAEAERAASEPISTDGREDRRDDLILTIDGAGAKDLDDAVSLRKTPSGWLLGVHIADVSHYVRERTPLDRAAMQRGTSVYFTDKVVPMLPPALSNGACSLNSGEDKYALSAFVKITNEGEIADVRIAPTVIRTRVRGVYTEVNEIFEGTASREVKAKYKEVTPMLLRMKELYHVLAERARGRGMLELDVPEAVILLSEDGEPADIVRAERGDAEKMIEQFMLAANEAVATRLRTAGVPCVYRVHDLPPEDKIRDFLTYSKNLGLDIRGIDPTSPDATALGRVLSEAKEREMYAPVSYFLLRAMAKAKYSDVHAPHFGLGIENYCHFTSPIRRLPDFATHRIIHRVLLEGKGAGAYGSYARRAAVAATDSELRAVGAERRIEDLYKTIYMKGRIGETFDAVVSSVTTFGVFAQLENTCEGLIPMSEMPGYFIYDERTMSVRSGSLVYRVGDKIRVRLEEADMAKCKLRFSLILD